MQEMHQTIENGNWILSWAQVRSIVEGSEEVMDRTSNIFVREAIEHGALALLPKTVRLLRGALQGPQGSDALCEFEVLAGNAAYQKGEHFFLTPARARRAYLEAGA